MTRSREVPGVEAPLNENVSILPALLPIANSTCIINECSHHFFRYKAIESLQ